MKIEFNGNIEDNIGLEIKKHLKDGRWRLLSKKGKNLGTFDTEEEVDKREKEVNCFKHKKIGS